MFKGDLRKKAIANLEDAQEQHKSASGKVEEKSIILYGLRQKCSEQLIQGVEDYINTLANSPKEFEKSFIEFRAEIAEFQDLVRELQEEYERTHYKKGMAAGVATGAGVAVLAPTAAMAVATTFGTASTGAAISTLSGAAASKAALAWIGGGALAKGGAGVAGGKALLALAGPVGWGIGATALVGGGLMARRKNVKIAEKAQAEEKEVQARTSELNVILNAVEKTIVLTSDHYEGTQSILEQLTESAPNDYTQFDQDQRNKLGALINHINSLSKLINKNVE